MIVTTKANNHSMIVWVKKVNFHKLTLNVFDLRDFIEGKYSKIEINDSFMDDEVFTIVENVWEKRRG